MVKGFSRCLLLLSAVTLSACYPYVNIPAQPGDQAGHSSNDPLVRTVSVTAVKAALKDRPVSGQYRLVLPKGANWDTYQRVLARLEGTATIEDDPTLPIIETREIRVRGTKGEVDVVTPVSLEDVHGMGQLTTVHINWDPTVGWIARRTHTWQNPVDQVVPPKVVAPVEPTVKGEAETEEAAEQPDDAGASAEAGAGEPIDVDWEEKKQE